MDGVVKQPTRYDALPRLDPVALSLFVFLAAVLCRFWSRVEADPVTYLADDAFYYIIVAKNIVGSGISTFDQQTLTNGYHPLWTLLLVAQFAFLSEDLRGILVIEILLTGLALWLFLRSFGVRHNPFLLLFASAYALVVLPTIGMGMEVPLFIFCFALFVRAVATSIRSGGNGLALGLCGALCVGARIDSVFFVLPIMLLALRGMRETVRAVGVLAGLGLLYGVFNLWTFGTPMPVSASVKSLGGLQLNHALMTQVANAWRGPDLLHEVVNFIKSAAVRTTVACLAAASCLLLKPRPLARCLCLGCSIGFALFAAKLLFASSWIVWEWYSYPVFIALVAVFHALEPVYERVAAAWRDHVRGATTVLAVALLGLAIVYPSRREQYEPINKEAAARFATVFGGERVAMGDRAGSFAHYYQGPLTQLEGLVGDITYFRTLASGGDVLPLLCERGVKYILAYQKDLGDYTSARVHVLRPMLTTFKASTIEVARTQEVGHYFDLSKYDNSAIDEGDNHLYAWRLPGCS